MGVPHLGDQRLRLLVGGYHEVGTALKVVGHLDILALLFFTAT